MSLINRMLQDLEHRSVGSPAGNGMHREVRAAPERTRLHPAWWLVVLLTAALIGVGIWLWLRPVPPAVVNPLLTLKIAPDLNTLPSPAAQAPVPMAQDNPSETTPAVKPQPLPEPVADIKAAPETPPADNHVMNVITAVSNVRGKPDPVSAKPEANNIKSSTSPVADASTEQQAKPAKLTKQIKDLTPQQLAENEYRQAVVVLQQGRGADAVAGLESALKLDPLHAGARQMLVGLLLQAKRPDEAMQKAQEGLAVDPSQVGLIMILARIQVEQNDLKSALATLEHGLPYANDNADYQAFLAALLQRDKRNKDAIDHYVIALGKSPQNSVWWMGLGISLQAENRLQEAKEAFSRAKSTNGLTPELLAFVNQKLTQLH